MATASTPWCSGYRSASAAETIASATVRQHVSGQSFAGDGSYLDEIDFSVLGLPLTFLSTNVA